jgi:hypothetical protein
MLPKPDSASQPRAIPIAADRRARLATLRVQLAQLEGHGGHGTAACLSLGAPQIHAHLPTPGLAGGVLHEVSGATYADRPAAFGFVVALMAVALNARASARDPLSPQSGERDGPGEGRGRGSKGLQPINSLSSPSLRPRVEREPPVAAPHPNPLPARAGRGDPGGAPTMRVVPDPQDLPPASLAGPAFLVASRRALADLGRPYGRGLEQAGLDPSRLVLVETGSDKDALWALEEVLSSGARPSVVAGAIAAPLGLTESRRLNLAAARRGTPLLVLGPPGTATSAAATRWHIAAAPTSRDRFEALAQPRWHIALERCRHGRPGEWLIEWDHATYRFRLAASLADRAPAAGARPKRASRQAG